MSEENVRGSPHCAASRSDSPRTKEALGAPPRTAPHGRTGGRGRLGTRDSYPASACCAAFRDPISPEPGSRLSAPHGGLPAPAAP